MPAPVPPMTHANLDAALRRFGWRVTNPAEREAALRDFQRGYALGPALLVDGKNGPRTRVAIRTALARNKAGKPDASEHFSWREFACRCGGRRPGCRRVRVHRELLLGLEALRDAAGRAVKVVSGYRCPAHNKAVGGATSSQHVYGAAADVEYVLADTAVRRLRRFSGIGRSKRTRKVRHVDVRHLSGNNTTGGTPDRPTVWDYAA